MCNVKGVTSWTENTTFPLNFTVFLYILLFWPTPFPAAADFSKKKALINPLCTLPSTKLTVKANNYSIVKHLADDRYFPQCESWNESKFWTYVCHVARNISDHSKVMECQCHSMSAECEKCKYLLHTPKNLLLVVQSCIKQLWPLPALAEIWPR